MNLFRNTSDQFFLAKSFDGQPTKNGSPLLMSCRLNHFLFRPFTKQAYYESIGDVDELLRQILLNAQLKQIGIPHGATDSFLLVFEVFEGAHHAPGGVITEPKQSERTLGLHCVCQTGYRDGGETLTFVNNWGRGWGKKGFGSVSVDYLRRHFYEAYVVRPAQFGLMPWKLQNVAPESLTSRRLREIHMVVNPRGGERRIVSNGETWRFEFYQTLSPTTDAPVECISIQTNFGLRMGWAFLRHTWAGKPEPRVTEIQELFVMPAFRRMGVGRELEHRAVEQAHVWQSSEIHLILNEADSVVGPPRHSARNYALALGYRWRIHNKVAPRRTGTAIKKLQTVDPVTKPITP